MRRRLTQIALGTTLALLALAPASQVAFAAPDSKAECHKRLERDKARVDRDAAKYGRRSGQVDRDVDRLETDRRWCREHHADWDHSLFDVGIYIKH